MTAEPDYQALSVFDIYDKADEEGLIKDNPSALREIATRYNLSDQQREDMGFLIGERNNHPSHSSYSFFQRANHNPDLAKEVAGYILDALHGNLDGWDDAHDKITIQRFLSDVVFGVMMNHEIDPPGELHK